MGQYWLVHFHQCQHITDHLNDVTAIKTRVESDRWCWTAMVSLLQFYTSSITADKEFFPLNIGTIQDLATQNFSAKFTLSSMATRPVSVGCTPCNRQKPDQSKTTEQHHETDTDFWRGFDTVGTSPHPTTVENRGALTQNTGVSKLTSYLVAYLKLRTTLMGKPTPAKQPVSIDLPQVSLNLPRFYK